MIFSSPCPCGSGRKFAACCEPLILGKAPAQSAEAVMRARYTAYVKSAIPYLKDSMAPETRGDFDADSSSKWAREAEWLGLEVVSAARFEPEQKSGCLICQAVTELAAAGVLVAA